MSQLRWGGHVSDFCGALYEVAEGVGEGERERLTPGGGGGTNTQFIEEFKCEKGISTPLPRLVIRGGARGGGKWWREGSRVVKRGGGKAQEEKSPGHLLRGPPHSSASASSLSDFYIFILQYRFTR